MLIVWPSWMSTIGTRWPLKKTPFSELLSTAIHRPLSKRKSRCARAISGCATRRSARRSLPPDTSKADREQVVAQVLDELGLTRHADTRVDKLSGGQRKRASVALELLTGPSLLILDEPTSGLDPALDLQVMSMLRQLADAGRVVLVVTHSLTYLDVCDQVLLMAPGGKTAFLGAPDQIGGAMGTTNWAQIFAKVGTDPDEANRRFLAQNKPPPPMESAPADLGTRRIPACPNSSPRSLGARSGWSSPTAPTSHSWRCCRSSWVRCR